MSNREPVLIGGRYELGEMLGRGGMAEVRKGTDLRLGRAVAVKRLRTDLASDATFQARFRREAQASASLNHPMIVAVYDTGEEMSTDGSEVAQPYIVMEYVAGRTLREILREGRKILPERALEITSGVLSALDYSHRAGIIHRDIKPGNVMLTPTGDVKVMDFGIARAISDASSTMTQTAAVVGTAQYLSPEQARGETVDSRSDVYSTGCLLYELLTGRPPFIGDSPVAVAYQHVRETANPPSDHDTELTPEVDAIVMKALSKRVEERYQSAAAMRSDIERYLAGRPIQAPAVPVSAPTAVVAATPDPITATSVAVPPAPVEDESRAGRAVWWIAGLLTLALIAAAAFLVPRMFENKVEQVRVPSLIGLSEAQAREAIGNAGLAVGDVSYESSDLGKDKVISQDPTRNDFVDPDTTVDFVVSTGKPMVQLSSYVGQRKNDVRKQLEALGLVVRLQEEESDEPVGEVLGTDPAAGEKVPEGSTVVVFFSDGRELVPNVVGKQEDVATALIEEAGFKVKVFTRDDPTDQPPGTVISQTPDADTEQVAGTVVVLEVTTYVKPSESPTPSDTTSPSPTPSDSPTATTTP